MKACMSKAGQEMMDTKLSEAVWVMTERGFEYQSSFEFMSSERMPLEIGFQLGRNVEWTGYV